MKSKNENLRKKFLIYGFGKSGVSCFKYLNKKNQCFIFDDEKKKYLINLRNFLFLNQNY